MGRPWNKANGNSQHELFVKCRMHGSVQLSTIFTWWWVLKVSIQWTFVILSSDIFLSKYYGYSMQL